MSKIFAIDYETDGLSPYHGAKAFAYVLTDCNTGDTEVYRKDSSCFLSKLKEVWGDCETAKVAHNLKFELKFTNHIGLNVNGTLHDTMIMHQLLDNLGRHGLDKVAKQYAAVEDCLRWDKIDNKLSKAVKIYGSWEKVPVEIMDEYQRIDGERTALVFMTLYPLIQADKGLLNEYNMEIDLIKTTARMEDRGILLAKNEAVALKDRMQKEVESINVGVNLSSPKQLIELLYTQKKLPILKRTKTGAPSTDNEVLEQLNDPVVDSILKHRSFTKGVAMVDSYLESVNSQDIIHPNINTNHAATGRESSSNPNMQNISKDSTIYKYAVPARCCFRARPGHVWFLKDYSSVEMRLGVQGTKSKRLIELISNDFDFHDATAKAFFKDRYTNATGPLKKDLRGKAKNVRFAMFYGAGIGLVCKMLGLPADEVKKGMDEDKQQFPEIYDFMHSCTRFAEKNGYIETFFGRRLRVPEDRPYVATDYCIQGSAAGVLKRAQIRVDEYLRFKTKDAVRLLLPVHDELIIEFPRTLFEYKEEILNDIDRIMCTFKEITVPMKVETEYTTTLWSKAVDYVA